jgi:copper chaperone
MAEVREITLSVPEIDCEHCAKAIDGALSPLAGVEQVSTDITGKTVFLRYDPSQVTMETIAGHLDDAGYTIAK